MTAPLKDPASQPFIQSEFSQSTFSLPDVAEKPLYVQTLFAGLAHSYDLMNDVMTMGMHRQWKKQAVSLLNLHSGDQVLDVCCGTGDLELYFHQQVPGLFITGLDFCEEMLVIARKRMADKNVPVEFVQGDAMALPFADASFNGVVISYGLRNVSHYQTCLQEMVRVLKPGGSLVILDMSYPNPVMDKLSGFYRFTMLPVMGKLIANDADAYRYLSNSIYNYLTQQALCEMMQKVGLRNVQFQNKLGGVCALHWGLK